MNGLSQILFFVCAFFNSPETEGHRFFSGIFLMSPLVNKKVYRFIIKRQQDQKRSQKTALFDPGIYVTEFFKIPLWS